MHIWIFCSIFSLATLLAVHLWWRKRFAHSESQWKRKLDAAETRLNDELSRAAAEQSALFNSMSEGFVALDAKNRIRLANRTACDMFGVSGDVLNRTILEAFRVHELDEIASRLPVEKQILKVELELSALQGRILELNASLIQGANGEPMGAVLLFHDLTGVKRLENTRQEFVANVSHELRTPLSLIKGYVETLIDGAKDNPQVAEQFLKTINKHADRLTFLIEDLLTISQLESGRIILNRQNVNARELIEGVLNDLATRARDKAVTLINRAAGDLVIDADAGRMEQVLNNLVDNALKYGRAGGHVSVNAVRRDNIVEIKVEDDGPGIPPEAQERIFERFYRVDKARSREQGGTGLGLSIVKHIVQSHGGKVWVKSTPGKGCAFYLTIPSA